MAYRLTGRGDKCAAAQFGPVARLDIAWRAGFGERARLQTAYFLVQFAFFRYFAHASTDEDVDLFVAIVT
jgi:hypothetical protein